MDREQGGMWEEGNDAENRLLIVVCNYIAVI